jgi:hypothetical protein
MSTTAFSYAVTENNFTDKGALWVVFQWQFSEAHVTDIFEVGRVGDFTKKQKGRRREWGELYFTLSSILDT